MLQAKSTDLTSSWLGTENNFGAIAPMANAGPKGPLGTANNAYAQKLLGQTWPINMNGYGRSFGI